MLIIIKLIMKGFTTVWTSEENIGPLLCRSIDEGNGNHRLPLHQNNISEYWVAFGEKTLNVKVVLRAKKSER